jgi:hypothetical protein
VVLAIACGAPPVEIASAIVCACPASAVLLKPSTTEVRTCEARIVPRPATPVAIPTWRRVALIPEAMPARAGATTPTAVETSGVLMRPPPMPLTIIPASR